MIVRVAIPRPLSQCFDYTSAEPVSVGARVKVSFAGQKLMAIVMATFPDSDPSDAAEKRTLKPLLEIIDPTPLLSPSCLNVAAFAARYYHYPIGLIAPLTLPKALRSGAHAKRILSRFWQITPQGEEALTGKKLGKKQQALLQALRAGAHCEKELQKQIVASPAWLENIAARGWIAASYHWQSEGAAHVKTPAPALNDEQKIALKRLPQKDFSVTVLDGVTGSGKTEIYIRWIEMLTAGGGQVLLLVPEIGLVATLAARLAARLAGGIAIHHSDLGERFQLQQWFAVQSGDAQVIVGTRSAIFLPFANLRAIIMDEEHDSSYKQNEKLRYHARDLAIWRAKNEHIPVLLGSATPSLEAYHHIWAGNWTRLSLKKRATQVFMPKVRIENLDGAKTVGGLTPALIAAMRRVLRDGGQVMLFLNRRGFAPLLRCENCDWTCCCFACTARMTAHLDFAQCHHCGRRQPLPKQCPDCKTDTIQYVGKGTQRLEQTVAQQFPSARILRIDTDAFTSNSAFLSAIEQVHAGKIDIILGTQWLSKGHHFANLQLAAVVDADGALFSSDFRAEERLAQLLLQVGGRAGRENQGEIWIQTKHPDHPIFNVFSMPYEQMARRFYRQRQQSNLPPVSAQVQIFAQGKQMETVLQALRFTCEGAKGAGIGKNWQWLGPTPAFLMRKNGQFRAQLTIQADSKAALQKELPQLIEWLRAQSQAFQVQVGVDVDPLMMV